MAYDCAVIGGGPAGLTAVIYARRAGLGVLLIEKLYPGGQLANVEKCENYPGFAEITGFDLIQNFTGHAGKYGYDKADGETLSVKQNGVVFTVITENGAYEAKTVIISTGAGPMKLGALGEDKFSGRGVSYCASCDGALYKNKTAAVIGGGNTAAQDALYLARLCEKVYIIHRRDKLRAERNLQNRLNLPNVEIIYDTVLEEIRGENSVNGIKLKNVKSGEKTELAVAGVFMAVGIVPNTGFIKDFIKTDEKGFILTDESMRTDVPGIFAAGDARAKPLRQIVTAAADGAVAAYSAQIYLNETS